jgi:HD-GYP domain-containing protein (c-di-GMP phosphodiesterase class II)
LHFPENGWSDQYDTLAELEREAGSQFDVRMVEALRRVLEDPKASSTDSPRVL